MRLTSTIEDHAAVINGWITSEDDNALVLMYPAYECYKQAYSSGSTFYFFGNTTMA
ncbi:hypothetical protein ACSVC9_05235 [Clostridium sp. LBM24168]